MDSGDEHECENERRKKQRHEQTKALVIRELQQGEDSEISRSRGSDGRGKQLPRRGGLRGIGGRSRGPAAGQLDDGRVGKEIPEEGAPQSPQKIDEYDQSYMIQSNDIPMMREPVIYNTQVRKQHMDYKGLYTQVKRERNMNHYKRLKDDDIDYCFWSLFHFDFYKSVLYTRERPHIVPMKYVNWKHVEEKETSACHRAIQTCENLGIKDLMEFSYDWNVEILAQFHSTYFHSVDEDAFHWMTEGTHYKVDFITFARLLGFGAADKEADILHEDRVMKTDDIRFMYEHSNQATGMTTYLKSYYYILNLLFRETIHPKGGASTDLSRMSKSLLKKMAPGSDHFLVSRFIWYEVSTMLDDAKNGLPYAPYIMFIIERVSGIVFKKYVQHRPYSLTKLKGNDNSSGSGTAAVARSRHSQRSTATRSSTSKSTHRGSRLSRWMKAIFRTCSYAATQAYAARRDINEIKQHLKLPIRSLMPPPRFSDLLSLSGDDIPKDNETLQEV